MAELVWDQTGERLFETGVSKGVVYPQDSNGDYPLGASWNGLTNVTDSPTGGEPTPIYADNIKYLNIVATEESAFSIDAYTYPDEFAECIGESELDTGITVAQQNKSQFGFVCVTQIGNDVLGDEYGYKIHCYYGCIASPAERSNDTINDSPEAADLSWDVSTTPVAVTGKKATAHLIIDSTKVEAADLTLIEDALFGTASTDPYLPTPDEILALVTP